MTIETIKIQALLDAAMVAVERRDARAVAVALSEIHRYLVDSLEPAWVERFLARMEAAQTILKNDLAFTLQLSTEFTAESERRKKKPTQEN